MWWWIIAVFVVSNAASFLAGGKYKTMLFADIVSAEQNFVSLSKKEVHAVLERIKERL